MVGCCNDELTRKMKGPTVLCDWERYESLRHCKWVDEVIPNAPWVIDEKFIKKHKIDYVVHDDNPYPGDVYEQVKKMGKFKAIQRTKGVSTTDIITRILKNYNIFIVKILKQKENKVIDFFEKLREMFTKFIKK